MVGLDTAMLQFDNCRVPVAHLIGTEGAAFGGIAMTFNDERLGLAASAIGFAAVAYEEALLRTPGSAIPSASR